MLYRSTKLGELGEEVDEVSNRHVGRYLNDSVEEVMAEKNYSKCDAPRRRT
jgi:hypothetical protein